jgi:glycosyltransferase involved in cell wall biosynthesis
MIERVSASGREQDGGPRLKLGVVGLGAVGQAVADGFRALGHQVGGFDIKCPDQRLEDVLDADILFLTLPTPALPDGTCDTSAVESVVARLADARFPGLVVVKSTIIPGTMARLHERHPRLRLAHNPEFLRERSAAKDFLENQDICVVGARNLEDAELLARLHRPFVGEVAIVPPLEAELVKYFANGFNALRVLYASQFFELCRRLGASYDAVKATAVKRYNIGDHYLDGSADLLGFGGRCLPKDVLAMARLYDRVLPDRQLFAAMVRENAKYGVPPGGVSGPSGSLLVLTMTVDEDDFDRWFFVHWLNVLAKRYATVHVICLAEGRHPALAPNVAVHTLGKERGRSRPLRALTLYRHLGRLLPRVDGVFIHMNQIYALLGFPLFAVFRKRVALWYCHRTVNWDVRLASHLVDGVLTATDESFPYPTAKKIVTGHGIDTTFFRPLPGVERAGPFKILTLGRITPTKNQLRMCEAMKVLRDRGHRDVVLHICSEPRLPSDVPYLGAIEAYIRSHGLEPQIRLLGRVDNAEMPRVYNEHDLFLNLAAVTGADKAVLEAMACGLNVVTSNRSFRDMLPANHFVETPAPEAVADAITRFLPQRGVNPALRDIVVRDHNLDDLIRKFDEFYRAAR